MRTNGGNFTDDGGNCIRSGRNFIDDGGNGFVESGNSLPGGGNSSAMRVRRPGGVAPPAPRAHPPRDSEE